MKTAAHTENYNVFDDSLPDTTMLTLDNICEALNIRDTRTWLKWCRQGQAPAPFVIGTNHCYRWQLGAIRKYLKASQENYLIDKDL